MLAVSVPTPMLAAPEHESDPEPVVYVPIKAPAIKQAPVEKKIEPERPKSTTARASKAFKGVGNTIASATFSDLPGTAVPIWWLLIVFLAIPLARLWRSWTAQMFEDPVQSDGPASK